MLSAIFYVTDAEAVGATFLQSPPEISSGMSINRGTTVDSDSDSTSTELCDEPDHMSDIDSEDLTSGSDSYVIATDDEKHSRGVESTSTTGTTPVRSYIKNESLTIVDEPQSTDSILGVEHGTNDTPSSLSEISIANITDQIRRLSAGDDNNTVPQIMSSRDNDQLSTNDYSIERSQSTKEMESQQQDYPADYTSSSVAKTIRSSARTVTGYDYSSFNSSLAGEETEDASSLHRMNRLRDDTETKENIEGIMMDCTGLKTNTTDNSVVDILHDGSKITKQPSISLAKDYDKFITSLDTDNKPYESTLRYSDNVYSKIDRDSNDTDITNSRALDIGMESTFYPKRYVVGHLPISPITIDNKLTKLSHVVHNVPLHSENFASSNISLKDNTFGDKQSRRLYSEQKRSPKSPESMASFSSGETMGPDSKPSSLTMSPRTPLRSDSRDFAIDRSVSSSISSDSKTLILHSVDSDIAHDSPQQQMITRKASYEKSSPLNLINTDSLRNKHEASPRLVISSSSDSCSPSKVKSSERSFSSDLQSPVSANSIRYTSNYGKCGQENISNSPIDLSSATSPFYPITNQKTPSPYSSNGKQRCSLDNVDTSPDPKSISSRDTNRLELDYQSKLLNSSSKSIDIKSSRLSEKLPDERDNLFITSQFHLDTDRNASYMSRERSERETSGNPKLYESISHQPYRNDEDFADDNTDDPLSERDVVPQLPHEKLDKHYLNYNYRRRDRSKLTERSSSCLERRFADSKSGSSNDEFNTTMAKKRCSDILEDMKHLEAKAFSDGSSDTSMLSKKTSDIWEDMKNLEARRQDTFSDSASGFSKQRLELPDISISNENRKSYVVCPRINIDENSDSILKSISCNKNNNQVDDGRESKVGVWTKVKPRKKDDNGRRSSDRALKIIQENSAILHKILTCQAKKRLPDLEEISSITISPINEEISKIFSPILEKIGLNEHEINEELARINFKELDNVSVTTVSEFDAKINDELSKLSLIDDTEQIDHLAVDEIISHDYSDTREAFIDRKINEELSKLLANYEEESPSNMINLEKGSSSQNISETEGLDITTSISTNVFSSSYKSSNDSIETKSEMESIHETAIQSEKFPYELSKYDQDLLPSSSEVNIHRNSKKIYNIPLAQLLTHPSLEMPRRLSSSPITYVPDTLSEVTSSMTRYGPKTSSFDTSPLKDSCYEPYKSYEFTNSRLSPRDDHYTAYEIRPSNDSTTFEYTDSKPRISMDSYDLHLKSPILSKESLEFRVKYDVEQGKPNSGEFTTTSTTVDDVGMPSSLNTESSYYGKDNDKTTVTPTKYTSKECLDIGDYSSDRLDLLGHKYDSLSPIEYSHVRSSMDYSKSSSVLPDVTTELEHDIGSYLSTRHRDYNTLSPSRQYRDQYFPSSPNHYSAKLSPDFTDEMTRPIVSPPEFAGNASAGRYEDLTDVGSNCYKRSTFSFGNTDKDNEEDTDINSKTHFSPFPVRNNVRKPKELTLKLGLYSTKSTCEYGQLKKS